MGTKLRQRKEFELIETAKLADEAGLDVFAVGESHKHILQRKLIQLF